MASLEEFMVGGSESIKLKTRPVIKPRKVRHGCKHVNTVLVSMYSLRWGSVDERQCVDCDKILR